MNHIQRTSHQDSSLKGHRKSKSFWGRYFLTSVDSPFWSAMIFGLRNTTTRWRKPKKYDSLKFHSRTGKEQNLHSILCSFFAFFGHFQWPNFENSLWSNNNPVLPQICFICFMVYRTWVFIFFRLKIVPRTSLKRTLKSAKTHLASAKPWRGRRRPANQPAWPAGCPA